MEPNTLRKIIRVASRGIDWQALVDLMMEKNVDFVGECIADMESDLPEPSDIINMSGDEFADFVRSELKRTRSLPHVVRVHYNKYGVSLKDSRDWIENDPACVKIGWDNE